MRILAAIFFEVNLLQSSRFGEALRIVQDNLDSRNFYVMNPAFDTGVSGKGIASGSGIAASKGNTVEKDDCGCNS